MRTTPAPSERTPYPLLLGVVLTIGALLRLLYLADEGFWFDEFWIWRQAQMSVGELLRDMIEGDVHPPLYQLLILGWANLAGTSEWALRLPSVVFGVLSIAVVARLGTHLYDRNTGLWAAGFLAVNEYAIYYSQEARSYSLLLLVSALTAWAWWRLLERATPRRLALYGVIGVLTAYTHAFGIIFLVYLALAYLFLWIRRQQGAFTFKRWLIVHIIMGLAYLPWVPAQLHQAARVQEGFWIPAPDPLFFTTYFAKFAGHKALGVIAFVVVLWVFWRLWRGLDTSATTERPDANPSPATRLAFLVGWFVFMLGLPYVVSVLSQPIMHAKSAISVLAPIAIVVGYGVSRLPSRARILLATLWVVGSLWAIIGTNYLTQNREAWREMSDSVSERFDPATDLAVLYHPDFDYMFCYHYYLDPKVDPIEMLCAGDACHEPVSALEARADALGTSRIRLLKVRSSTVSPDGLEERWEVESEEQYNNGVLHILRRRDAKTKAPASL